MEREKSKTIPFLFPFFSRNLRRAYRRPGLSFVSFFFREEKEKEHRNERRLGAKTRKRNGHVKKRKHENKTSLMGLWAFVFFVFSFLRDGLAAHFFWPCPSKRKEKRETTLISWFLWFFFLLLRTWPALEGPRSV